MPAANECIDWAGVRTQVTAATLEWITGDPGTGTLPNNRVNTADEFWTYLKTAGANPFPTGRVMNWTEMQANSQTQVSQFAARFISPGTATTGSISPALSAGGFCIEAWVRWQSGAIYDAFLGYTNTLNRGFGFQLNANQIWVKYGNGGGSFNTAAFTGSPNTWYHVAMSWDSTTNVTFYVNGTAIQGSIALAMPIGGASLYLGHAFHAGSSSLGWTGTLDLDGVRVWTIGRAPFNLNADSTIHVAPGTSGLKFDYRLENNGNDSNGGAALSATSNINSYITSTPF